MTRYENQEGVGVNGIVRRKSRWNHRISCALRFTLVPEKEVPPIESKSFGYFSDIFAITAPANRYA